ncbi:DUF222 domain-containing protein [Geodermatophilus sp. SYSU D00779]
MDDGTPTGTLGRAAAPVVGWATGPLGAVQAADREISRQTALKARAVAEFATSRPASADRAQGERGAMSAERWAARPEVLRSVSEWATPELAIALNLTQPGAARELERSVTLVHRLPATLAALESGVLHAGHLWHLIEHVAPIADDRLRAEVEAELLAWLAGRHRVTSPAQLGDKARRLVAQRDAAAAGRRLARALRERGVSVRPDRVEGMAAVSVYCSLPEARAFHAALVQCADAIVDEPGAPVRTRGQKMVDALLELVLRPGESELPPVRVLLTLVASVATLLGGDAPAELDGELLPAEMARRLAHAFAGVDPVDGAPAPGLAVAWQEAEQAELAAWWDEMERRLLAGELPDEPTGARTRCPPQRRAPRHRRAPTRRRHRTPTHRRAPRPQRVPTGHRVVPRHCRTVIEHRAVGGRPRIGRWRTPVRRCTPPGWHWAMPPAACAPRPGPTPMTRPPGRRVPPGGWTPPPARWARWPPPRTPSARSWPPCWTAPPVAGWPTGPGSRSPTRSAARC